MSDRGVVTYLVDGHPLRLREPHDLGFLRRWGRVFAVLDDQDSGNLCFGVEGARGRVFVKYAGAATARYGGGIADAVDRLSHAEDVYRDLVHPSLVRIRDRVETAAGLALVFGWVDAVPLGRQYQRTRELEGLTLEQRAGSVQQLLDERFMAPEEFELGAVLDQVTNVVSLGSLAHSFLGDDETKARSAWRGSDAQWEVAERARNRRRTERWPSIAALADAWRATLSA